MTSQPEPEPVYLPEPEPVSDILPQTDAIEDCEPEEPPRDMSENTMMMFEESSEPETMIPDEPEPEIAPDSDMDLSRPELEETSPGIDLPEPQEELETVEPEPEEAPRPAARHDNQSALPFDHQTNKELALSKPFRKVQSHNRPELDLNPPSNRPKQSAEKLPEYQRRDISTIPFNPKKREENNSILVDTANFMIPAFLRRKAD